MEIQGIVTELRAERDRLERAIDALSGSGGRHSANALRTNGMRRPRRRLSAAAKRRISAVMKKTWAERKRKGAKAS